MSKISISIETAQNNLITDTVNLCSFGLDLTLANDIVTKSYKQREGGVYIAAGRKVS